MTDKRFRILIGCALYVTIGYVTPDDIAIGVRLRSLVDLSDVPAGTIGIVEKSLISRGDFFCAGQWAGTIATASVSMRTTFAILP